MPGHILYSNVDDVNIAERAWEFMSRFSLEGDENVDFEIQAGLTGAWFNPATDGQGLLIEPIPFNNTFFAAWFTFDQPASKIGAVEQTWFTLQGTYEGGQADLEIFQTSGGVFNASSPVMTEAVGSAIIQFSDCTNGSFAYAFDEGPAASMPLSRITPNSLCGEGEGR